MKINFMAIVAFAVLVASGSIGYSQQYTMAPNASYGYPDSGYAESRVDYQVIRGQSVSSRNQAALHSELPAPEGHFTAHLSDQSPLATKPISHSPPASMVQPASTPASWDSQPSNIQTVAATSVVATATKGCAGGCTDGSCGGASCDTCCAVTSNCYRNPCQDYFFFGEYLYLNSRNSEINYASQNDGPVSPDETPTFNGTIGNVDTDYSSGARVGVGIRWDDRSSLIFTGTTYESSTSDAIMNNGVGNSLFPTTMHPTTFAANSTVLDAAAQYSIDFDLVDADFRAIWCCGENYQINYLVGVRYTRFEQDFAAQYDINNTTNVLSDVSFDGGGIRLGLDGERFRCGTTGLSLYGKTAANFIAGQARGRFFQEDNAGTVRVDANWEAGRVMTQLEAELGMAWTSPCENWRLSAGYMFSGWFNTVQVSDMIEATHTNQFDGMGSTLSFDGLTTRLEYRY